MLKKHKIKSYKYVFERLFENNELKGGSILSGAAISSILGSNLPLGKELLDSGINSVLKDSNLKRYKTRLKQRKNFQKLTPENVFELIIQNFGNDFLSFFDILKYANPNSLHKTLSEFINSNYCNFYTTNFDLLVDMFCNSKHDVIHIHGSLEDKSKLSVTLRTIAKGISLEHSKGFKEKSLNKSLLVIGYSGNDKDVIDLINESSFQKIYWMIYDIKNEWELQNISSINKNIILFEGDLIRFDKDLKSLFGLKHNLEDVISRRKISINKKQIIKSFNYPTIDQLKFLIGVYNSIGAYESVIEICSKFKNKIDSVSQRQYLLNRLCAAQRAIGSSFSSASYYANQAIKLYNVNGYSKFEYIMSLNLKGLIFLEKKRSSPKDALKKFLDLDLLTNENKWKLAFKDEIQMKTFKGRLFNNIGLCYMELKSYSQAQKYFKEAITSKRENGDLLSEIITLCNLCVNDLYFLKKEKKIVIDRLLFLFVKYENDVLPQIAYYYRRTGMVNCEIGNIKVGIKRLEKSIAIYKKLERTDFDDLLVKEYLNKYGA